MKIPVLSVAVALAGLAAVSSNLRAQSFYTFGHGDLGIEYDFGESSTEFEPHWHLHDGAIYDGITITDPEGKEFAPDELVALASATSTASASVGAALGLPSGTTVYRLGTDTYEPELGFGTEELDDADWLDGSIVITLTGFDGPGQMAFFSGSSPSADLIFSTYAPGSTIGNNSWDVGAGADAHLPWYFSEAGDYTVTFTWTGTYIGEGAPEGGIPVTGIGSFQIAAVPEPGMWGLLSAVALGGVAWRHRRARKMTA